MRQQPGAPMTRPTGSVYLDAPRPSRYRTLPRRRAHDSRTIVATVLGIVGLLALSAVALLAGVRALVAEPDPIVAAVGEALDEPVAREELRAEIATAIERDLIGEDISAAVATFGVDVHGEATRVAFAVLDDPAFRLALDDLVAEVHHRAVVDAGGGDLDLTPLTEAVLAVLRVESPDLTLVVPEGAIIATIDGDSLPDLTRSIDLVDQAILVAVLMTLTVPLAALVHPRRHKVVAWLGRWLLVAGLMAALLAVGLPYLGAKLTGWVTVEAAVRTMSLRLLAPAGIAGIAGMGLVTIAGLGKNRERRQVADQGAAAALGVSEPPEFDSVPSAQLDLARRGLVDADRPLTNI